MNTYEKFKFQDIKKFLKKRLGYDIKFSYKLCGKHHGLCEFDEVKKQYTIKLNKMNGYHVLVDTLVHEYAHVMRHKYHRSFSDINGEYHDDKWGACFAEMFRLLEEWIDDFNDRKKQGLITVSEIV